MVGRGDGKWERDDTQTFLGKPARKMLLMIRRLIW